MTRTTKEELKAWAILALLILAMGLADAIDHWEIL